MNLFFHRKYRYEVYDTKEDIRREIKSFLKTSRHEFSNNISGSIKHDGRFRLYPRFSLAADVFGIPFGFAVIDGKLESEQEKTIIKYIVRPPYGLVIVFYLIAFFLLKVLLDLRTEKTMSLENFLIPIAILLLLIALFGLIRFSSNKLLKRFERLLNLKHDE